jgi:serine/threonine-protein phosphatase 2A regulatory subunit B'
LEELDISDSPDGTVPEQTGENKDDIHPDMQQFDVPPTQYQSFRRKSIIPVDETVRFRNFIEIMYNIQLTQLM